MPAGEAALTAFQATDSYKTRGTAAPSLRRDISEGGRT